MWLALSFRSMECAESEFKLGPDRVKLMNSLRLG